MNKYFSYLTGILILISTFSILNSNVIADSGQYGQYGANLSILIDKMVAKPGGGVQTKGGIVNYLKNCGLTEKEIFHLRSKITL